MTDLGTLGGAIGQAQDIKDLGHGVATSQTSGANHAFQWMHVLPPPASEERIGAIIERIHALAVGGWLTEGQGNVLQSKLDSVSRQLDMQNAGAAGRLLQAFLNMVDYLVRCSGLTAEQGQPLNASADAVSSELCLWRTELPVQAPRPCSSVSAADPGPAFDGVSVRGQAPPSS